MKTSIARASLLMMAALFIAGCTEATFEDIAPKAEKRLPPALVQSMRAKGMSTTSPDRSSSRRAMRSAVWRSLRGSVLDIAHPTWRLLLP